MTCILLKTQVHGESCHVFLPPQGMGKGGKRLRVCTSCQGFMYIVGFFQLPFEAGIMLSLFQILAPLFLLRGNPYFLRCPLKNSVKPFLTLSVKLVILSFVLPENHRL